MNPRGWNEKSTPSGQEPSYRRREITFAGRPPRVGDGFGRRPERIRPPEPPFRQPRSGVHWRPTRGLRAPAVGVRSDGVQRQLPETLDRGENLDLAGRQVELWARRAVLPVVLVEDGQRIEGNLARERITLEELAAQARLKQIDSIDKVRWAVLETSGAISFIPKGQPR